MTSTVATRRHPAPTAATPEAHDTRMTMADGSVGGVEEMSFGDPASYARWRCAPITPPASPPLIDDKKAADPDGARAENERRVAAYFKKYGAYAERFGDAARDPLVSDDTLRSCPPLARPAAAASLPEDERAHYETMAPASVMRKYREAGDALGDRTLDAQLASTGYVKAALTGPGFYGSSTAERDDPSQIAARRVGGGR